uniref:Uncharacterized protein n=1 Tax=viral metagenome TaxID=1070528 RepID=A0A6H1ZXA0_9ZZZZ
MYNQVKWFGRRPTVKTAQTPAAQVAISTSTTEILNANDDRASFLLRNTGSVTVYFRLAATATTNDMPLEPGEVYYNDDHTGIVDGIVASGAGEITLIEN